MRGLCEVSLLRLDNICHLGSWRFGILPGNLDRKKCSTYLREYREWYLKMCELTLSSIENKIYGGVVCHSTSVEITGKLLGVSSLLPP